MSLKESLTHKYGPLPAWAWMGVAVIGLIIISAYRQGKITNQASTTATGGTTTPPGDQTAPPVTVVAYPPVIVGGGPAQDGRPTTGSGSGSTPPVSTRPPSPPPTAVKPPPPPPPVSSTPTKPALGKGVWVPIGKWNASIPGGGWNTTLWGIAQHIYGDGNLYPTIQTFNHIANPRTIQPGQVIWVPQIPGKNWAMGTGKPGWAVNQPPPPGYTYSY